MIGGRRPLQGRKPADRRVRVERPHSPYFRYTGPGQMVAKAAAHTPKTGLGRTWARIRGVAIGRPLASEEEAGERLSKKKALAIFSSDAISSSAYATQEIIRVLAVAGATALAFSVGVSVAIAVLLAVVAIVVPPGLPGVPERRRRVRGREGEPQPARSGLVAAAALLIDYVMTVAVSTASAIGQIVSVVPSLDAGQDRDRRRRDLPDDGRQPARPARVREHLRDPDLRVPRARPADGRARAAQHRDRRGPPDRRRRTPRCSTAAPSCRSSCCSRRSPAARSP